MPLRVIRGTKSLFMQPIQELLNRIRWDQEFGAGYFELSYEDHVMQGDIRIPLQHVDVEAGNHFAFQITSADGSVSTIPLHRIRAVYKDGELLWQRPR